MVQTPDEKRKKSRLSVAFLAADVSRGRRSERAIGHTGVDALSQNGTALLVQGRAKFSTAGTAVISSGQNKVTVTLAGVTTSDFVLATVPGSGSFYVKNAAARIVGGNGGLQPCGNRRK